jgi:ribosomal protein S18 acetylase RimI-like enzyme
MDYTIRPATDADFDRILLLIREFASFQKSSDKVKVTLEQMKQSRDNFRCLVAENDKMEIVGYTTFFTVYYTWTGKAIYLDDLYVNHEYRGRKIGTLLMEKVFEIAKNEKCTKVRWQVSNWNMNAIAFYKKLGASVDDGELNCDLVL